MRTDLLFISDVVRQVLDLIDYQEGEHHPYLREQLHPRSVSGPSLSRPSTAFHVLWTADQYLRQEYPEFVGIDLGEPRVVGPRETARMILTLAQALNNVLPAYHQHQCFISFGNVEDVKHFGHCEFHFEFLLCFLKTIIAAMKGQSFKTALIYKLNAFIRERRGRLTDPPLLH